jgi:hypothetical protein
MTELERALVAIGSRIEFPPEPDLARAVRARLEPRGRLDRRRLSFAIAFAVLAVLVAALAVPSARSTLLRWFHLRSVTIERVDTLPPAEERPLIGDLGSPMTPAQASQSVGFELMLPRTHGKVRRVYVTNGLASIVLRTHGHTLLLNEFRGRDFDLIKKVAGQGTLILPVSVNGEGGFWIAGGPHVVNFLNRQGQTDYRETRFAGNVLLWLRGELTLRLEGPIDRKTALEIARGIR